MPTKRCQRGHDLSTQSPPYLDREGRQRCRECQRSYKRAWQERQAEERRQLKEACDEYFELVRALIIAMAADEGRYIPDEATAQRLERLRAAS